MLKTSCRHALHIDQIQGIFRTADLFLEPTYVAFPKKNIKLMYFIQLLLEDFNCKIHEYKTDVLPEYRQTKVIILPILFAIL